jgi:hypothetical protein
MSKITFEAVKTAVEANKTITDRGDLVRAVALALNTTYGNVYLKVRKAEAELGLTTSSRKGRRPGSKTARVNVVKSKTGEVVAEGVTPAAAAEMIEKAKKAKKGALKIA